MHPPEARRYVVVGLSQIPNCRRIRRQHGLGACLGPSCANAVVGNKATHRSDDSNRQPPAVRLCSCHDRNRHDIPPLWSTRPQRGDAPLCRVDSNGLRRQVKRAFQAAQAEVLRNTSSSRSTPQLGSNGCVRSSRCNRPGVAPLGRDPRLRSPPLSWAGSARRRVGVVGAVRSRRRRCHRDSAPARGWRARARPNERERRGLPGKRPITLVRRQTDG
jgi:hypothetical protein